MDSPKLFFSLVVLTLLLSIYVSCSSLENHGISTVPSPLESKNGTSTPNDDQKVNLTLYYESLNTDSAVFLVRDLKGVFDNDLITILNLRLVPWGKTGTTKINNASLCQNGNECNLNTIQACSIDAWKVVDKHFGFIYCIEFLVIDGRHEQWQNCSKTFGLPLKPIMDCYNSGNGTKLEQKYGNETMLLNPPLKFVPWLVLNNQPLENDYANFTVYVCKAYKGIPVPQACQSVHALESKDRI